MNQLIKASVGKVPIYALLIIGIVILVGCSSKPEETPTEAAPAAIEKAQPVQEPVPAVSQAMPEYDPAVPAVVAPPSFESNNDGVTVEAEAPEVILVPVLESNQSELFAEHDAAAAISEELFLEIINPSDKVAFVETATFMITARTLLDAAVSVNDDLVDVNEEGILESVITLVEGHNLIEVVASVSSGEEKSTVLTIFYLP